MPHAATGVEHSLSAEFYSRNETNLVVAGANVLRVFRLTPEELPLDGNKSPKMRLECYSSWSLHSPITSMAKVSLPGSLRDTLILSFQEAKLSVVEYDPETNDLRTISLHIFEDEETRQGFVHNYVVPFVRADPDSRCAAMLVYGRQIVILPFKGGEALPEKDTVKAEDIIRNNKSGIVSSSSKVLASYTLDLKSVIQTNNVDNIIDIQFLHGYNQPTLLILYEPLKTFAGRIAVRKDTCRLDVITLDVKERISAFIWSREVLPFDCVAALAVPKPIGGTLVFAVNSMFYLNQGMPPYGVSLNSIGDRDVTTDIHVKPLEGTKISLDCAKAEFMSPERAVISLKGGELYVLTLLVDSMRMIRGFHMDKSAASVLTTCLTVCDDQYLFLGSRLGNSLLLQFTEKDLGSLSLSSDKEPPTKKKRIDVSEPIDIDFEVYGQMETSSSHQISTFTFEVCDSLLNIGPCGNVTMGEPAFLSEEFMNSTTPDPDIELVSTSGHGKNGALCVLQRNVRPQVVTTLELPGCSNVWTVIGDSSDISDGHAYLILSRQDSTMILRTEQEINQLDQSGFYTEGPTIFTGNLGGNKYIVQVIENEVRLLHGSELLTQASFTENIVSASSADPHLLLLTEKGQLILVTLEESHKRSSKSRDPKLNIIRSNQSNAKRSQMRTITAFKDVSGIFTSEMEPDDLGNVVVNKNGSKNVSNQEPAIENEDDLLYGDSAPEVFTNVLSNLEKPVSSNSKDKKSNWNRHFTTVQPSFWALGIRDNGDLEIYSLPNFTLKFSIAQFYLGSKILSHSDKAQMETDIPMEDVTIPNVTELLMVSLGSEPRKRPVLMARLDDQELLMYEVYPYCDSEMDKNSLKMRFCKLNHGLILRERRSKSAASKKDVPKLSSKHTLKYFQNVAGYEGVFVGGPYPHWVLLTGRGELRRHPMGIDGSIPLFAPFHNVNCPNGFIYFNRKGELRICVLPTHLSYDAPWPVRKVPLRCTPHFITYHLESKTYAVVTSVSEATKQFWKFNGDDKELRDEERSERFPWPSKDRFFVQLFSPVSWEPIPGTKIQLDEWERCTSMKHLYLSSEGLHTGQRGYIVCSTSFCYGEDVTPRGYIRIYDVIEVIPEPGQPLTKNKIKTVYDKEQKGPITAITSVNGFLVATVGQKIYIFQFKNKDLFGVAFIDSQIYIHQLTSIKNFILVGDVMKSVDLLQFQQDYRTLSVISRDSKPLEVYGCEYLVDNTNIGFLVTDADKNIIVFVYQPEARESSGGSRLLRKADFNLGQHVCSIFRIRAKLMEPSSGNRILTGWEKRQVTWFATLDGGIGYMLPINEKMYRRLLMLQNVLISAIPHIAGLNPKGSRLVRTRRRDLQNPCRGIIDADLVYCFTDLPLLQKAEISKKIGTKLTELMEDLAELDRMAAHF
ncbi:CPSF1 [Lepeophtheirus salmonis]|nr:CPSF1 [Lepeophtheirus salmonis]CAF2775587.1 CPSF1 [Lepeophtheirus salmonis]